MRTSPTYTDPEIAHVGLHELEAKERGLKTTRFQIPLDGVDRAILDGDTEGFLKVIVRAGILVPGKAKKRRAPLT